MANLTRPTEALIPTTGGELVNLLDRAGKGDQTTLPVLRKLLEHPDTVSDFGGDLAREAERAFTRNIAGEDLARREAILRKLELMRGELAGPNPSPVERLLAERCAMCWLQCQDADLRYARSAGEATLARSEYHQRRQDRSHKRYLSALRTLALVRKLAVPNVQVNIARKQQVCNHNAPAG